MSPKNTPPDKQLFLTREKKIIILFVIPLVVFAVISCRAGLDDQQIADLAERFNFSKFGAPVNGAIITFLLLLFGLFAFFPLIRLIQKFFSALTGKYFVISLAALAVLGAVAALYIPSYTNWFKSDTQQSTSSTQNDQGSGNQQNQSSKDPSSDLRLHLLYIAGGIIAVLGLIETNRKNSQDHTREVHAARRDRYIEAVDKLSSDNAPVRLGGVYALVGLVDEWLDDDNIDEETRIKEGQIIINNLCSYIRRPFSLADKLELLEKQTLSTSPPMIRRKKKVYSLEILQKINKDKISFKEEKEIRQTIISEIRSRLSRGLDPSGMPTPGPWSKFTYDFSGDFFYPVDFSNSHFKSPINFGLSNFFESVNFSSTFFNDDADFIESSFRKNTLFERSIFNADVRFQRAEFTEGTGFSQTTFKGSTDFSKSIFNGSVLFLADFYGYTTFSEATFFQDTQFTGRTFYEEVDFSKSTFKELSIFIGVFFNEKTIFSDATFAKNANFSGATFAKSVNFSNTTFEKDEAIFASGEERAKFSVHPSQEDYNFSVSSSSKPIHTRETKLNDVTRRIPIGTVLFDPLSPKDENGKYRESPPA
ncbi:pentapeptide repeat-containing protein [uncultured Rothia sp.]|uniref:pentapeptide repeat-containing protein n=1 Tax=uncultured Rothia sp. TaxID=316088 RepID=UPI0026197BA8|nr:pentapeptide repeat-containing protein [uncultured Rothia sp.]